MLIKSNFTLACLCQTKFPAPSNNNFPNTTHVKPRPGRLRQGILFDDKKEKILLN